MLALAEFVSVNPGRHVVHVVPESHPKVVLTSGPVDQETTLDLAKFFDLDGKEGRRLLLNSVQGPPEDGIQLDVVAVEAWGKANYLFTQKNVSHRQTAV